MRFVLFAAIAAAVASSTAYAQDSLVPSSLEIIRPPAHTDGQTDGTCSVIFVTIAENGEIALDMIGCARKNCDGIVTAMNQSCLTAEDRDNANKQASLLAGIVRTCATEAARIRADQGQWNRACLDMHLAAEGYTIR